MCRSQSSVPEHSYVEVQTYKGKAPSTEDGEFDNTNQTEFDIWTRRQIDSILV